MGFTRSGAAWQPRRLDWFGVTPSELLRQALQYAAKRGQLPFKPILMTEDDEALLATVRERLAAPQRVKVSLDDLES
ncbi:type II toxin-antitoxin system RelB/DinJ family antitoxin [Pseudomonas sp. UM16]|uniref:type II toxin-antitoxin system RelB/DinJ family antitoxin n=1 Tax=Pseudomonas sp. UM16 TaxID=3158962 RepID=UPI00398FB25C